LRERDAKSLATTHFISALADECASTVRERIDWRDLESFEYLFVVDAQCRLVGIVPLRELMSAAEDAAIGRLMQKRVVAAPANMHQGKALALARRSHSSSLPVVDETGRLVGALSARDLLEIAGHEHSEDISRLAGIVHQAGQARAALDDPPFHRVLGRLPWLLIGVVGSMMATLVMAHFKDKLSANVAIVFFVPAIVYLADAIGTQTEAIVVRGLSGAELNLRDLLLGEITAGALIGLVLAVLTMVFAYVAFADFRLAAAVALSVALAGATAAACGVFLPWLLSHFGADPAFGSGPVATVIQDIISVLVYLSIASIIVPP
jgi:magnesium transporter